MLILGSRLLFIAALAWGYEALVFAFGGSWPNVAWADLVSILGGDYGIEMLQAYLRTPDSFFEAPVGTSCFAAGLPIFLVGLAGFRNPRR